MTNALSLVTGNPLVAGEKTVVDLALAEALGFERPTNIRKLIRRHRATLEAMGLVLQSEAPIRSGKGRVSLVTEYHLNRAQAAFIIAKAGTKRAESLAAMMAEVFAMFDEGKLVAVDQAAAEELEAVRAREARRRHEEEREARSEAFAFLR